jgi:hypothetical protein
VSFVTGLGVYDRVVTYDDLSPLARTTPVVLVDVAGSAPTLAALGSHLGEALKKTVIVGMSHWSEAPSGVPASDANSEFFFAPSWAEKRQQEWGLAVLAERVSSAWQEFMRGADKRCRLIFGTGEEAVASAYRTLAAGDVAPDQAHILSFWENTLPTD